MRDLLFDPLIGNMHTVLDLRSQQHQLTASNIANMDTPNFRARYIDFEELLPSVMNGGAQPALLRTDSRHLEGLGGASQPAVEELEPPPWALDGNSVHPERETARLSSNALMYTGVARGLGRRLALLRYAATNGRA